MLGATMVEVGTTAELLQVLQTGLKNHQSTGHDPFETTVITSFCIEGSNLETQSMTKGRLSFYDMPGCDRCSYRSL